MLHFVTYEDVVAAVDVEAKTWRIIPMPYDEGCYPFTDIGEAFISLSQGKLYLATNIVNMSGVNLPRRQCGFLYCRGSENASVS